MQLRFDIERPKKKKNHFLITYPHHVTSDLFALDLFVFFFGVLAELKTISVSRYDHAMIIPIWDKRLKIPEQYY